MDASTCLFSILNTSIPEKVDLFIGKPIESEITTADILKGVVSTIFDYAVQEPTFCPMFAQLCSDLKRKLDPFPSDEPGGLEIRIRRVMLNTCQHAFEGLEKLREQRRQMNATIKESASSDKENIVKPRALFIEELKSPHDYPEFVKEAIYLFLNRSPPCVEPIAKLLDYMLLKKILVQTDLRTGCRANASLLDDFADNYLELATTDFGEIMGPDIWCCLVG
ncbi:hypothetical protein LXL04_028236 [Taraxacum kok-saghyz]